MGFYGNITNNTRSSFTFDRTYSNRRAMDASATSDGVFVGRYVLVDYDSTNEILNSNSYFKTAYKWLEDNLPKFSLVGIRGIQISTLETDDIIVIPGTVGQVVYNEPDPETLVAEFWKCTGKDANSYNTFELMTDSSEDSYSSNYHIDIAYYGKGRGYDSTVWQKVVTETGAVKYVMIAELNSVVPTFGITPDAPTMIPTNAHWGKDSTNIYYNLHWPVPWGFRIKGANPTTILPMINDLGESIDGSVVISSDEKEYPSDEYVTWQRVQSDPDTGVTTTLYAKYSERKDGNNTIISRQIEWTPNEDEATAQPAAIYYNRAGLAPEKIVYSSDKEYNGWGDELLSDSISLTPTGHSGYGYNSHTESGYDYEKADSMELSVMLPSLGDTIAHMWDLIYGDREANNGRSTRNMDIAWENARYELNRTGLRLVPTVEESETSGHLGYRENQVNTIAGALNSVHDLMGMVIVPENTEALINNLDSLDENRIYYDIDRQDYYRKKTGYIFTDIEDAWTNGHEIFNDNDPETGMPKGHEGLPYTFDEVNVTADNFDANIYYELINGEYVPLSSDAAYDAQKTYYGRRLKEPAGAYRPVELLDWDATQYWYQDYIGGAYGANDDLHQDYIQSKTYEFGRKYYTDVVAEVQDSISEVAYEARKYYYKDDNGNFILDTASEPERGRVYYKFRRQLTDNDLVNLPIYVPNQYYYEDGVGTGRYKLATTISMPSGPNVFFGLKPDGGAEIINNKIYVRSFQYVVANITADDYTPGTYYVATVDNPSPTSDSDYELDALYIADGLNTFDPNQTYYVLDEMLVATTDVSKALDLEHPFSVIPFIAGVFFRRVGNNYFVLTQNDVTPRATGYYVFWDAQKDSAWTNDAYKGNSQYNWKDILHQWYIDGLIDTDPTINEGTGIYSYPSYLLQRQNDFFQKSTYHKRIENECGTLQHPGYNYMLQEKPSPEDNKYTLITSEDEYSFDNNYAYLDINDEWVDYDTYSQASWEELVEQHKLYSYIKPTYVILRSVTPIDEDLKFYYPYKYYEKVGDYYHLLIGDHIPTVNNEPVLTYEKYTYYVLEDTSGIHQHGEEWNPSITYLPSTVTLGVRTEQNMLEGIAGFARDVSTIHGLILKLLQTLEFEDSETRDIRTVRGMLNTLNDIFTKIHNLQPGDIIYVNDYGQISSTPVETDNWIDVKVNSRVKDPSIVIQHETTLTTVEKDKINNVNAINSNNGNSDDISFYLPQIDAKGHVVGSQTQTITLPYTFKTITPANNNSVENLVNTTTSIEADNIRDTLTIEGANTWIHTAGDSTNDKIQIGHLVQSIDKTAINNGTPTDINGNGNTITLKDFTIDEAGHVRTYQDHIYTLPYGFKTIAASNVADEVITDVPSIVSNNQVADNTQDTLTIAGSNKWIRLDTATEDTVKIGHLVQNIDEEAAASTNLNDLVDNQIQNTITLQDIDQDEAGHIIQNKAHVYTLPSGFKTISDRANNSTSAANTQDTFTIGGDNWVVPTVNAVNKSADWAHANPNETVDPNKTVSFQPQSPSFGSSFNIPTLTFDTKGHNNGHSTATVTIPALSVTPSVASGSTTGTVVTSVALPTPANGAFTETKTDLSAVELGSYTAQSGLQTPVITAQDTLGLALSKLEKGLEDEAEACERAVEDALGALDCATVTAADKQVIGIISQTDGLVTATLKTLTSDDMPALWTYNTTETQIDEQTNEEITVEVEHEVPYSDLEEIISDLNSQIAILTAQLGALQTRVAALEPTPTPVTHNVTVTFDDTVAQFGQDSFEGGDVNDEESVTIVIEITDPDTLFDSLTVGEDIVSNDDPNLVIDTVNNTITYTFTPTEDVEVEFTFTSTP